MEICVKDAQKFVEIWLTNGEKQDAALRAKLHSMYREYKEKNFFVAVFESGGRSLADATSDLLCYNRKRLAQQEARFDKSDMVAGI